MFCAPLQGSTTVATSWIHDIDMDATPVGSPLATFASLLLGLFLLYISILTLTLPHWSLPYIRLALAPPTIRFFWNFGYGSYEAPTRALAAGMSTISLYGIMRVVEHSVIYLWDPKPPHWVIHTQFAKPTVLPLPNTFQGRCLYALDLLTSLRGSSWFPDLEWSWIPPSIRLSLPPLALSRKQFITCNVRTLVTHYVLLDLCDTINKSRIWEAELPNPVTSLPILQQFIFTTSLCAGTVLSITIPYTLVSSVCVLFGSSPCSWPPMFNSPFFSKSLRDFWSRRWHAIFRRVFERLSIPPMNLSLFIFGRDARLDERVMSFMRLSIAFALSTLLHLIIMHRLALRECRRNGRTDNSPFLDASVLRLFLSQPLGLFLESMWVSIPLPFGCHMSHGLFTTGCCRCPEVVRPMAPSRACVHGCSYSGQAVRGPISG